LLSESQRAAVAGELANMKHGGNRRSDQSADLHFEPSVTLAAAADLLNVSRSLVADAKSVQRANPEPLAHLPGGGQSTKSSLAAHGKQPSCKPIRQKLARVLLFALIHAHKPKGWD